MLYDAVLFDLDGTLTRSERGIINSINHAFNQVGEPQIKPENSRLYIGPPLTYSFSTLHGMPQEQAERCVLLFRERYNRIGWSENEVYIGIPRLLQSLKSVGAYIALATAKPQTTAKHILRYFGLDQYFDCVIGAAPGLSKPSKLQLITDAMPKTAHNVAMVGDTAYDMRGAAEAGVTGIGVSYGYGTADELHGSGAAFVASTVEELHHYLLGDACAPGQFISIEGIDGCGKTTQLNMLHEWLMNCGYDILVTREPGGDATAEKIRTLILDKSNEINPVCEAYLYAAARAQHVRGIIRPALDAGQLVLCDRFVDSSIAYQGYGRGLGAEFIANMNAAAVEGCMPTRTLIYDIAPDIARTRIQTRELDRMESEKAGFHKRVREGFQAIAAAEPMRTCLINAQTTPELTFEQTRKCAMTALGAPAAGTLAPC